MEMDKETIEKIVKSIKLYKVESTNIDAIGYSTEYKTLRVIFKNSTSYLYFNVEESVWEQLQSSPSKGRTLNESVIRQKTKYSYIKL